MISYTLLTVAWIAFTPVEPAQVIPVSSGQNPNRIYQLRDLKTSSISVNAKKIKVWIMDTPSKRNEGMMFLKSNEVKLEQGMLFVFPNAEPRGFWMKNTLIPLDIAYMNAAGKVLNVEVLKPLDENGVPSKGATKFVLEMKRGGFKKFGIKNGSQVQIPKSVRADL